MAHGKLHYKNVHVLEKALLRRNNAGPRSSLDVL